jgi:hypothetical protein
LPTFLREKRLHQRKSGVQTTMASISSSGSRNPIFS